LKVEITIKHNIFSSNNKLDIVIVVYIKSLKVDLFWCRNDETYQQALFINIWDR
jgi:hypothetical protein